VAVYGVWIGYWIYWHNSELQIIASSSLISKSIQVTAANINSSPVRSVFNNRFPVMDVNTGDSSASCSQVLPVWRISRNCTISIPSISWKSESEPELLYDWRFTANQFVLTPSPLRPTNSIFFLQNICCYSPYVTSSLTRRWVCRLQLLLVLASTVILESESRGTPDHILLS
jgi:hypothetical protein